VIELAPGRVDWMVSRLVGSIDGVWEGFSDGDSESSGLGPEDGAMLWEGESVGYDPSTVKATDESGPTYPSESTAST
jgi:hypothetical protein